MKTLLVFGLRKKQIHTQTPKKKEEKKRRKTKKNHINHLDQEHRVMLEYKPRREGNYANITCILISVWKLTIQT